MTPRGVILLTPLSTPARLTRAIRERYAARVLLSIAFLALVLRRQDPLLPTVE